MTFCKTVSQTLVCLGMLSLIVACQPNPPASTLPTAVASATAIPATTTVTGITPPVPSVVPTLTPLPTPTFIYPPKPTLTTPLVERISFNPLPALPKGLSVTIFRMNQPILAEGVGYEQVQAELKERSRWVEQNLNNQNYFSALLDANNAALTPFGYRMEKVDNNSPFDFEYILYHGDQAILEKVLDFSPVSVNRSNNDFMLLVVTNRNGRELVRSRSIASVKPDDYQVAGAYPQFLGDDVLSARMEQDDGKSIVRVYRNNLPIYQTFSDVVHALPPLYGLQTYGVHWAVEVLDSISIDGQAVNQLYHYQKSYEFSLLTGIPIYFFEKNGKLGLNFNGQEVLLDGQSTPHYNCCSGSVLNPRKAGNMLRFFMQNGEQGYYVEVEVKP